MNKKLIDSNAQFNAAVMKSLDRYEKVCYGGGNQVFAAGPPKIAEGRQEIESTWNSQEKVSSKNQHLN